MTPNIRVDKEVYDFLKQHAEPFADTPNSVLRRLLKLHRDTRAQETSNGTSPPPRRSSAQRASSSQSRRRKRPARAPAGALLPESEYVLPILQAISELGGSAPARDVIEQVGERLDGRLSELDRQPISSGAVRWRNRTQFVRFRLVEEGLLAKDSPKGVWMLSRKGRDRLVAARAK